MLKIFTTQLAGYFQKIMAEEELNIEEAARIFAQVVVNGGVIYVKGFGEMASIELEVTKGAEPLPHGQMLAMEKVQSVDCVLLTSRYNQDEEMLALAKQLKEKGIPTISISAHQKGAKELVQNYVDVAIDTKLIRQLLPADDGSRYGYPSIITGLFAYYGIAFTMKEILEEYE